MRNLTIILFLLTTYCSFSQKYETLSKVWIPNNATIIKTVKVKDCETKIDSGYIVKTEFTKKSGEKIYTFTKTDSLKKPTEYKIDKEIKVNLKNFSGYANLSIDEKDKTKLLVNYWLNDEHILPSKTKIKIIKKSLQCPKGKEAIEGDYKIEETTKTLEKDTKFRLWKVQNKSLEELKKLDWFIHTDSIIEVYNQKNEIEYYLVNKYDRNANYELKLKNREFISYRKKSVEFGPLTIPFKYRFGYSKDSIKVKQEFNADLNIGFFGGYRLGKYRIRYEGDGFKQLANISGTIGGFLSLSSATLDKTSTTAGKKPFTADEKSSIGVISPGVGIMLDVYNVNFGAFLGWDIGFGNESKNWNFNNKPWVGLGIGYNLNGFWKK